MAGIKDWVKGVVGQLRSRSVESPVAKSRPESKGSGVGSTLSLPLVVPFSEDMAEETLDELEVVSTTGFEKEGEPVRLSEVMRHLREIEAVEGSTAVDAPIYSPWTSSGGDETPLLPDLPPPLPSARDDLERTEHDDLTPLGDEHYFDTVDLPPEEQRSILQAHDKSARVDVVAETRDQSSTLIPTPDPPESTEDALEQSDTLLDPEETSNERSARPIVDAVMAELTRRKISTRDFLEAMVGRSADRRQRRANLTPPSLGKLDSVYRVLEPMASGGFGEVWSALHLETNREVAVKLLHDRAKNVDPEASRRFEIEILALSHLRHPHIVHVHDIGTTTDGRSFMIMERVWGQTLRKLMSTEPPNLQNSIQIAGQVLRALEHMHSRSPTVIHRDLTPSNVMVELLENDAPFVTLIDFGVVKLMGSDLGLLTQAGFAVGTLSYMSPEQIMGATLDPTSDLFSVAIMLYEMVAGYHPFKPRDGTRLSAAEYLKRVTLAPPHPLERISYDVSSTLEPILQKALRKEPTARYGSASAFLADLANCRP